MARFKSLFDEDWPWKRPRWNGSWAAWNPPPPPEPVYVEKDEWPTPKPREDQVFAKSCTVDNWCRTDAGTALEPASNFGKVMVAGAMLLPSASTAVATAIGADLALGRVAGGGRRAAGFCNSASTGQFAALLGRPACSSSGCCRPAWATARCTPTNNCAA